MLGALRVGLLLSLCRGLPMKLRMAAVSPLNTRSFLSSIATSESSIQVRYTASTVARVGWFLSQSLLMLTVMDRVNIATVAPPLLLALRDALLTDKPTESVMSHGSYEAERPTDRTAAPAGDLTQRLLPTLQRHQMSLAYGAMINLFREDLDNIVAGRYKYPYDLDPLRARDQWSPPRVLQKALRYAKERRAGLARRGRKGRLEVRERFDSSLYPEYYMQNFHYQKDGWLSSDSAEVYDYQVESLFLGSADAMRRQILPAMLSFLRPIEATAAHLDIATGTGRFMTFVMDNVPSLNATVMDLSPYYLEEARSMLKSYAQVKYVQAAVERMPFPDDSFDSLSCVYLFHELPREVRVEAVREMHRVLRPGGKLFFVDSIQRREAPFESMLSGFSAAFHEPYFDDYVAHDLKTLFEGNGFQLETSNVHYLNKCLVLSKSPAIE